MAFFCPKTGARIVAPGVSKGAGGNVPEYDGTPEHIAAENAAVKALIDARKSPDEIVVSPEGIASAVAAATAALLKPTAPKADPKPVAPKPEGRGQ